MKSSLFFSLALGVSWIFAPEALVIAGNVTGQIGWLTFPCLIAVTLLYIFCNRLLSNESLPSAPARDFLILQKGGGSLAAATLSLAACLPLTILAGTALLVTAGYTLNEVFLYWFPNFGFSFLLLALLTILQLLPRKLGLYMQLCFTGLAISGLLLLALYGVFSFEEPSMDIVKQPAGFSLSSASLLLILFVGYNSSPQQKGNPFPHALILGCIITSLWMLASLAHVTPDKLSSSTIPYMTAAKTILGEPGRQLIGVVIISGTCGALNGLMVLSRNIVDTLAVEKTVPSCLSSQRQRWLLPCFLVAAISTCMATGLAGYEVLETYLRSALILWLLYYSLLCLSAIQWVQKETASMPYPALCSALGLLIGCAILILGDPRRLQIGIFILAVLFAGGLLTTGWSFINGRHKHVPQP